MSIDPGGQRTLLEVAREAIAHGAAHARAPVLAPEHYPEALRATACSFVTLHLGGALRGCIGSLHAHQPLVSDVASHAFGAAFSDARFIPVGRHEVAALHIHISILSALQPVAFETESQLLAALEPGTHGLLIALGQQRATFLPAVWSSISEPRDFLAALKNKAGMPAAGEGYSAWRYTTQDFEEPRD